MSFQSLPVELLCRILDHARPDDFENLVLCSKKLHGAAHPKLVKHNRLRKRYRHFKFDQETGTQTINSVPQLLLEIAINPSISNYIRHVDMTDRRTLDEVLNENAEQETGDQIAEGMNENLDFLRPMLKESTYLAELDTSDEFISEWLSRIMNETMHWREQVDYSAAFLLTLLPNVLSLRLSVPWSYVTVSADTRGREGEVDEFGRRVRDLVQIIIRRANDTSLTGQSLAKLHTIHPIYGIDSQSGSNMRDLVPFMALDSLRIVNAASGYCEDEDVVEPVQDDEIAHENYAEFEFSDDGDDDAIDHESDAESTGSAGDDEDEDGNEDSDEDGVGAEDQHSEGSWNGSDDGNNDVNDSDDEDEEEWETNRDRDDLADPNRCDDKAISRRYRVLGRNIEEMHLTDYVIDSLGCVILFRDMKKLRHLEMEYCMKDEYAEDWDVGSFIDNLGCFVGDTLEVLNLSFKMLHNFTDLIRNSMRHYKVLRDLSLSVSFFSGSGGLVDSDDDDSEFSSEEGPIVPLIRILPSSLEKLHLYMLTADHEHLERLFRNFQAKRGARLPKLKSVTLQLVNRDAYGTLFPEHETQCAIIESFGAEHGLDVVAPTCAS